MSAAMTVIASNQFRIASFCFTWLIICHTAFPTLGIHIPPAANYGIGLLVGIVSGARLVTHGD